MPWVVRLQLEALLDRSALFSSVNLYQDAASLTRLDDFVEVKVCRRASCGRYSQCSYASSQQAVIRSPRRSNRVSGSALSHTQRRLLGEFERRRSGITHPEGRLELFSREDVSEVAACRGHHDLWPRSS